MIEDRHTSKNLEIVYVDVLNDTMGNRAIQDFNELRIDEEKIIAKVIS